MGKSLSGLNDYERRMHADGRCTGCGVKVKRLHSGHLPEDPSIVRELFGPKFLTEEYHLRELEITMEE